jgi:hypothetical protein
MLGLVLGLPISCNLGFRRFRARALEKLGLPAAVPFALAYFTNRRFPRSPHVSLIATEPGDVGVVSVTDQGVAFLGLRGTRFSAERGAIASVDVGRVYASFAPRVALVLRLGDGSTRWIAFLEGGYRSNRLAAERARAVLAAALESRAPA